MKTFLEFFRCVMRGLRAFTVQTYTEANIKNGLQYYSRLAWASSDDSGVPFSGASVTSSASNTRYIYFETGSKGVIVKDRVTKTIGEEFTLKIYQIPPADVALPAEDTAMISNFRGDDLAIPTTIQHATEVPFVDVDLTNAVLIDDAEHFFGSTSTGQSQPNTLGAERERIIPSDTGFIVAIQMTAGGGTGRFEYFLTWYEGSTDLPRKEFS